MGTPAATRRSTSPWLHSKKASAAALHSTRDSEKVSGSWMASTVGHAEAYSDARALATAFCRAVAVAADGACGAAAPWWIPRPLYPLAAADAR